MKLLMDRMLPISICDKNADIKEKITININTIEIPEREEKGVNWWKKLRLVLKFGYSC